MRLMLVNSRQKIAVLASGLAIATTGFVTDTAAAGQGEEGARPAVVASAVVPADPRESAHQSPTD